MADYWDLFVAIVIAAVIIFCVLPLVLINFLPELEPWPPVQPMGEVSAMNYSEHEMIGQLLASLRRRGLNPQQEVHSAVGVADIVTDSAVYEVLAKVTADSLMAAIPRLVALRDAIDPQRRAVIYSSRTDEDLTAALTAARLAGVTVNFWAEDDQPGMN